MNIIEREKQALESLGIGKSQRARLSTCKNMLSNINGIYDKFTSDYKELRTIIQYRTPLERLQMKIIKEMRREAKDELLKRGYTDEEADKKMEREPEYAGLKFNSDIANKKLN